MSTAELFTSRILVIPDSFGYNEIVFDIETRLNISKPIFIYINDEKSIKIEQLRLLQSELASAPLSPDQTRVVIIHPLEKILHVAQQSLLKLLEEPPERTLVILAGNSVTGLAPTLLSRCEVIIVEQSSAHPIQTENSFWTQAELAESMPDFMALLSTAPDKKDEAVTWLRTILAQRPTVTQKSARLAEALTEAYEALLSNVTPKLVWGRVVARLADSL